MNLIDLRIIKVSYLVNYMKGCEIYIKDGRENLSIFENIKNEDVIIYQQVSGEYYLYKDVSFISSEYSSYFYPSASKIRFMNDFNNVKDITDSMVRIVKIKKLLNR